MAQRDEGSRLDSFKSLFKDEKRESLERSPYLEPEDSPFWPAKPARIKAFELTVVESLVGAATCESESLAPAWLREETASLVCIPAFSPEWALWVVGERK